MFDIDRWQEIFSSIRSNVLRTVLSGFTVALGLYIFVVLFGIGKGLQNSFTGAFRGDASNLIQIFTGQTSIAYRGMQSKRTISLHNPDYQQITTQKDNKEEMDFVTPRYSTNMTVKYGNDGGKYQVVGANPDEEVIEKRTVTDGRYLTPNDFERNAKVAVIGRMVQRDLLKVGSPIGKYLSLNGIMFRVVGVFSDEGGDRDERMISVPISTIQGLKKSSDTLNSVLLTYKDDVTPDEAIKLGDRIKDNLKKRNNVSPDDEGAITVFNNARDAKAQFQFLGVLTLIVGVIGIGTLTAGIIGISNIMVYMVKERTKEIGVRKAIGAKPRSIVTLIMQESIVITTISGLIGVGFAILTVNLLGDSLEKYFIKDPSVGSFEITMAFFCLIISGAVAGFVPAYRASKIKPIEALRSE